MKFRLLDLLDFYSFKPFFYINGKKYYSTFFSVIISFICFSAIFAFIIYFLVDMFDKSNFTTVISTINPKDPLSINFTNEFFYFGMALEDPVTYDFVLNESIYTVNATYRRGARDSNGITQWEEYPVELESCKLEKFPTKYQDLFRKKNLKNMYCVKNFTYTIEGTFLHDVYSFLLFNFYQCKNTTYSQKCKSNKEIERYLNGTFTAMEFTDISIDPTNYLEPDIPIIGEGYSTVSNQSYRELHVFLKQVSIKKDRGIIFSKYKQRDYIQLDFVKDMNTFVPKNEFCSITLKISNRIDLYLLRYRKLQNTIADIGGVLKVITVIGTVLTFLYSRNKYDLELINSLFYIPNNKEFPFTSKIHQNKSQIGLNNINENGNNTTSLTNAEMINMHIKQKEISNICSPGMGIFNKDKKKCNKEDSNEINFQLALQYNKFNKKYKNIIKLSFLQLCFLQIKNRKHKERDDLLNKGIKIIMRRLDIINYFIENVNFQKIKVFCLLRNNIIYSTVQIKYV